MLNGRLILAVDLRNSPKGSGYGWTHRFIYIDRCKAIFRTLDDSCVEGGVLLIVIFDFNALNLSFYFPLYFDALF